MVKFSLDDNDAELDGAGAMGEIFPPPLSPGVKFHITGITIQLINIKGLFGWLHDDDPNMH